MNDSRTRTMKMSNLGHSPNMQAPRAMANGNHPMLMTTATHNSDTYPSAGTGQLSWLWWTHTYVHSGSAWHDDNPTRPPDPSINNNGKTKGTKIPSQAHHGRKRRRTKKSPIPTEFGTKQPQRAQTMNVIPCSIIKDFYLNKNT